MKKEPLHIHAIVLAAGLSRRMGAANKLLLAYGEHTILEEVLTQLGQTDIGGITVVLGHEEGVIKQVLSAFPVARVFNADYAEGQGSSIRAGVGALPPEADGFLICLGDMPSIKASHYQEAIDRFCGVLGEKGEAIWRPYCEGKPGHPVGFSQGFKHAILAADDPEGNKSVMRAHRERLVKWETAAGVYFWDIDTREEYERRHR